MTLRKLYSDALNLWRRESLFFSFAIPIWMRRRRFWEPGRRPEAGGAVPAAEPRAHPGTDPRMDAHVPRRAETVVLPLSFAVRTRGGTGDRTDKGAKTRPVKRGEPMRTGSSASVTNGLMGCGVSRGTAVCFWSTDLLTPFFI